MIKHQGRYSIAEERFNWVSHFLGALLSIAGGVVILSMVPDEASLAVSTGIWVYVLSLIVLYLTSSVYHYISVELWKKWLQKLDHCAIYVKIAGTYTPFLVLLGSIAFRHELLIFLWSLVVLGVVLKMVYAGRFNTFFTILYLAMGWMTVFLFKPLYTSLSPLAFSFLIGGGVCFSVGVIFYLSSKIPFNHAIWHLFVLAGSTLHYFSILDLMGSI